MDEGGFEDVSDIIFDASEVHCSILLHLCMKYLMKGVQLFIHQMDHYLKCTSTVKFVWS